MTMTEHLTELRKRLIVILGVFGVVFIGLFFASRPVLDWIVSRAHVHIIVIGVPEAFFGVIKVDFVLSIILTSPVLLYEIAAFILPGLTRAERRILGAIAGPGTILFLLGSAAGFFFIVPVILHVMKTFVGPGVEARWTLSNYLNFIINLSLPFGFAFELPLFAGVLARMGLVGPHFFRKNRRFAIFIAFAIAAFIAPPDASAMLLMGGVIYSIYEISGIVVHFAYRKPEPAIFEDEEPVEDPHVPEPEEDPPNDTE